MKLLGWGSAIPDRCVTNADLAHILPPEVVERKTGILERRWARPRETASLLGTRALEMALDRAGIVGGGLDWLICTTNSGDTWCPPTACRLAAHAGVTAPVWDLNAACSGFLYGLILVSHLPGRGALVATEVLSPFLIQTPGDWPSVIFADGAACLIVEGGPEGLLGASWGTDGAGVEFIEIRDGVGHMDGPALGAVAGPLMVGRLAEACGQADLQPANLSILVPHQANLRLLETLAMMVGLPMARLVITVDRWGNASSASLPLALIRGLETGQVAPGMTVGLVAFGGGLTAGALVWRL